jgi:hypothetical protein
LPPHSAKVGIAWSAGAAGVGGPREGRNDFGKVFTNAVDHSEVRREHWTASATYVFADHVANEALSVNPLGLTIVRFRTDQAFS